MSGTITEADVVIVGAGPAGANAALALADAGIRSLLVDDNHDAGGQVWRTGPGDRHAGFAFRDGRADALRAALARNTLIEHRAGTEVVGLFDGLHLWLHKDGQGVADVRAKNLIVATGAVEQFVPVPGWTLPSVFGLGGLQSLLKAARAVPQGPVVLAGAGPLLHLTAAQLAALGADIVAVVDAAPRPNVGQVLAMASALGQLAKGLAFDWSLVRSGIPILRGHAVAAIRGDGAVAEVDVVPLDAEWRPQNGPTRTFRCETVGLGFGVRPNVELTRLLGCEHDYTANRGGWHARRGEFLETTVPGVFVAGDGGGIEGVEAAIAQGIIAAHGVAQRLGKGDKLAGRAHAALGKRRSLGRFRDAVESWSRVRPGIFQLTTPQTIVCRCEDAVRAQITDAAQAGYTLVGPMKMNTRIGMGLCQGRTCTFALQHIMAAEAGIDVSQVGVPSNRTPLRPIPIGDAARMAEG
jgi:thioredoxin reductase